MASSSAATHTVALLSSDGQRFEVDEAVARMSVAISNLMDDMRGDMGDSTDATGPIPLPNVAAAELARVLEFCRGRPSGEGSGEFDTSFASQFAGEDMHAMLLAANYLDIRPLLDALSAEMARRMAGKTTQELREMLGIENDLTPEEEEKIRRENAWSFD